MKPTAPIARIISIICLSGVLLLAGITSCWDRTADGARLNLPDKPLLSNT
ncbi:MAG: hypothetical protein IKP58_12045 [Victivallales bacterium]|nr:hypothetical protein [Victivallales bacterium]